jgi:hypothetical protein
VSFNDTARQLEATDQLLNQAGQLAARGKYPEAEKLYQESLKNIVDLYGANSLKTCSCLLDLADLYYTQEKFPEVITLLEQVLVTDHSERIFPDEKILAIKFKFGKALEKNGSIKQASEVYSEVLSVANIVLGPNAPFSKTISESLRSLAKRNSSVAHAQQSQTGQTAPVQPVDQFDTFKQQRIERQSTSQKLIPNQSTSAKMSRLDVAINQASVPTVKMRGYDAEMPSAPNFFRQHAGSSITLLAVACLLSVGLFLSGVLEDKRNLPAVADKNPGASVHATPAPGVLASYTGVYSSTDGIKQFDVQDSGTGILRLAGGQREVKVSNVGSELYAESEGKRLIFRTSGQGLVDERGVKLFKNGSPEMNTVEGAQKLAMDLNRYYSQFGQYPHTQMELQQTNICYNNAISNRATSPRLMAVSGEEASSSMTLSDYQNANWMAANLLAQNGTMGEPGGLELHVFPVSSSGETIIIRGFDRDGHLLPSSQPGRCFATILVSGTIRR